MSNIFFKDYITKLTSVLDANDLSIVSSLANDLLTCWNNGNQVFLCGNGGSAGNIYNVDVTIVTSNSDTDVRRFRIAITDKHL